MRLFLRLFVERRRARLGEIGKIVAGREGTAGAGVVGDADFRIGIRRLDRISQHLVHLRRQCVLLVRAVDGDDLDTVFDGHEHMIGHRAILRLNVAIVSVSSFSEFMAPPACLQSLSMQQLVRMVWVR